MEFFGMLKTIMGWGAFIAIAFFIWAAYDDFNKSNKDED